MQTTSPATWGRAVQALDSTLGVLRKRIEDFEALRNQASSTDLPSGQ